jgi:hypothetical protein
MISGVRIVSLDKFWMACHFTDSDETALIVKAVKTKERDKGLTARPLPYAVTGTARDTRRRTGRAAAFQQDAAAHIGAHALEGCDNCHRRRRARNDLDGIEPGAFEFAAVLCVRRWSQARNARQREHAGERNTGVPCERSRFHCMVLSFAAFLVIEPAQWVRSAFAHALYPLQRRTQLAYLSRDFQFAFPDRADTTPTRAGCQRFSDRRFSDRRPSSARNPEP